MAPPVPLYCLPMTPRVVAVGDHGETVTAHLVGGDNGYVYLPTGATVVLSAVEQSTAPLRQSRAARAFGGAGTIDGTDRSLVSYALQASDTAHAGVYDLAYVATYLTGEVLTFQAGTLEIVA